MNRFNCKFERCAFGLFSESDLVMIVKKQIFPSSHLDGCPRACVYIHIFIYIYIYLILAALSLCCCTQAVSRCGERMLLSSCRAQASHCGGFSFRGAPPLACAGSVAVVPGLRCSTACRIFPDQVSNMCLLHWQADSRP